MLCGSASTELVAMNGGQGFTYQWQRNGTPIANATNERYVATQAGDYRVVTTKNGVGNTSDKLQINNVAGMYTLKSGSWSDPGIWSCGFVPSLAEPVTINHTVTILANQEANALQVTYGTSGKLIYNAGGRLRLGL